MGTRFEINIVIRRKLSIQEKRKLINWAAETFQEDFKVFPIIDGLVIEGFQEINEETLDLHTLYFQQIQARIGKVRVETQWTNLENLPVEKFTSGEEK